MAILIMLSRKMLKNRWLVICLLSGMTLSTALASSIPIYKNAILQRMLVKELEKQYLDTGTYPSSLSATLTTRSMKQKQQDEEIYAVNSYWEQHALGNNDLQTIATVKQIETTTVQFFPMNANNMDSNQALHGFLVMSSNINEHLRLIDGRFPSSKPVNGAYEVMVTSEGLNEMGLVVGREFTLVDKSITTPLKIKLVGIVEERDIQDIYWDKQKLSKYRNGFIVDEHLFEERILSANEMNIGYARWFAAYDYSKLDLQRLNILTRIYKDLSGFSTQRYAYNSDVTFNMMETKNIYEHRENAVQMLQWSLNVPMYILILFYLYMVSDLLVQRQKNEISLLRSRGAGKRHIVSIFVMESFLLTLVALLIGPWIGRGFTEMLGSTDLFMNFVQRKALHVSIDRTSFLYAGVAACVALIINIIPILLASRSSIVDSKIKSSRQEKRSYWHLFGFDFILLGLSGYGLFTFHNRINNLVNLGLNSNDLRLDPLLFVMPSLLILGFSLLLLRVYPLFLRLVYKVGESWWPPAIYSSLLYVGRRSNRFQSLMLFLLLTVGTGLYSASAARTLNNNIEDQIRYRQGSEIVLEQRWASDAPTEGSNSTVNDRIGSQSSKIHYEEPDFNSFQDLPGVESAARVFVNKEAQFWFNNQSESIQLMGIDTDDFGRTAWIRADLLPYDFHDYLNLIALDPHAVLISRTMAEHYDINVGDSFEVGWSGTDKSRMIVYGIVSYFPTFNPNPPMMSGSEKGKLPLLVVGHLVTIQNEIGLEPYQVWLKLKSANDRQELFQALIDRKLKLTSIEDTYKEIADSRSDPFRTTMNGWMTLGFLLSLIVSFVGFLLFWILSLKGRMLQFGIFRAMGISSRQVIGMLAVEQLLTSLAAIGIGLMSGGIASLLFVPMFQLAFNPGAVVPPFKVVIQFDDILLLIIITGLMLVTALIVLWRLIISMNINQTVKLGED